MKKIIVFVGIFVITVSAGYFSIKFFTSKNSEIYDTTQLSTATINNVTIETTGVIAASDENGALSINEGIKLLGEGSIKTDSFRIIMPGNGSIEVVLNTPYDKSKEDFVKWLKENGYSHLDPTQFNYTYSEQ